MKLTFVQSGGFAGLQRGCVVEVGHLPAELQTLVARAQAQSEASPPPASNGADLTQYSMKLEQGNGVTEWCFDDANLPTEFAPLVEHLASVSGPVPLG